MKLLLRDVLFFRTRRTFSHALKTICASRRDPEGSNLSLSIALAAETGVLMILRPDAVKGVCAAGGRMLRIDAAQYSAPGNPRAMISSQCSQWHFQSLESASREKSQCIRVRVELHHIQLSELEYCQLGLQMSRMQAQQ
jgi:hypothetical protein